jgi:hypothetical protein
MNAILGGATAGVDAAKKELTKATAGNKDLLAAIIAAKGSEHSSRSKRSSFKSIWSRIESKFRTSF